MRIRLFLALLAAVVVALPLLTAPKTAEARGSQPESYDPLKADPAVIHSGFTAPSSLDSIDTTNDLEPTYGNPTIAVDARLSQSDSAAGETVVVGLVLFRSTTVIGYFEQTATAQAQTSDGYFLCKTLLFDSAGATHYHVINEAPSLGNAVIRAWSYGADSKAAGE